MTLVPGGGYDTRLPAPAVRDVLARMEKQMALKDAEIALVAEQQQANLSTFLSWNARHFAGKVSVPALTPREWLRRGRDR
jgi:glycine cleavage system aminomethyltransferase T